MQQIQLDKFYFSNLITVIKLDAYFVHSCKPDVLKLRKYQNMDENETKTNTIIIKAYQKLNNMENSNYLRTQKQ